MRKLNPTVFKLALTLLNIVFSVRSFAQLIVSVSVTAYTQYWRRTPPSGMNSEEKVRTIIISGMRASSSVKDIVKFHNFSVLKEKWHPSTQTATPWTITFRAFLRGMSTGAPTTLQPP